MKKILLISGIISFHTASAQQPGFFDIQKHLEKKNKSKSQPLLRKPVQTAPSFPLFSIDVSVPEKLSTLSHTLPNGNKVFLLPQDQMPCIVPDMGQFNMPTAMNFNEHLNFLLERNNPTRRIPNLVTPYKIIPTPKDN